MYKNNHMRQAKEFHQGNCGNEDSMGIGRYILIGTLLFIGMLIVFGEKGLTDYISQKGRMMALIKENNIIRAENTALSKRIERLQTDPRYIESIARNDLGMVKKGDIVYRFVE